MLEGKYDLIFQNDAVSGQSSYGYSHCFEIPKRFDTEAPL